MRCTICRQKISHDAFVSWRQSHYLTVHPEYPKWMGRWMRNFMVSLSFFIVAMIVTEYLGFTQGGLYGVVAVAVIVSFVGFCVYEWNYVLYRRLRRFAREWQESHPGA